MTVRSETFPVMRPNYEVIREDVRKYPDMDVDAVELLIEFARVSSVFFAAADSFFGTYGISRSRFTLLVTLAQTPEGLSPAQLAESLQVSRATITGLLDTLEKAGYVERRDDPTDRRMYTIVITPTGVTFLNEMLPANYRRAKVLMKPLSTRDRADLIRLLRKVEAGVIASRAPEAAQTPEGKP